jgi:hypothetical protein
MKDANIIIDDELESQNLSGHKQDWKPSGVDPISDWLLKIYYMMKTNKMKGVKAACIIAPFAMILLFTIFVSNTTSNVIAFSALIISLVFIGISIWILCWILEKD